ncbi:MAG: methylenetetrahydrofolate reductase C-terminal domain-containing protein [Deltaproteobacteria bacterium]|jgi:ferredoxin|nr:methylenetetrahydrofolate reductase C-terminal domain-containing protein [Deltaproteobacteria bacterium]
MIVGQQKPIDEIWKMIRGQRKVLVLGCNSCVAVCHQGGTKQAEVLASLLRMQAVQEGIEIQLDVGGIERQCEHEFFNSALDAISSTESVLSLACGVGVQFMAEKFKTTPVYPALNTTFLGAVERPGYFTEKCQACGNCVLAVTGGLCPIARCAKRLLNGPCGGVSNGKCEINKELDCVWQLIVERLEALGRLDDYEKLFPLKDWSKDRAGGPRTFKVEGFLP